jgi:hypothetical protein
VCVPSPVLLPQLAYAAPVPWWLVFLAQWFGHAGHLVLVALVLMSVVSFPARVRKQELWCVRSRPPPC